MEAPIESGILPVGKGFSFVGNGSLRHCASESMVLDSQMPAAIFCRNVGLSVSSYGPPPAIMSNALFSVVTLEQGADTWREWRHHCIGASDAPVNT